MLANYAVFDVLFRFVLVAGLLGCVWVFGLLLFVMDIVVLLWGIACGLSILIIVGVF